MAQLGFVTLRHAPSAGLCPTLGSHEVPPDSSRGHDEGPEHARQWSHSAAGWWAPRVAVRLQIRLRLCAGARSYISRYSQYGKMSSWVGTVGNIPTVGRLGTLGRSGQVRCSRYLHSLAFPPRPAVPLLTLNLPSGGRGCTSSDVLPCVQYRVPDHNLHLVPSISWPSAGFYFFFFSSFFIISPFALHSSLLSIFCLFSSIRLPLSSPFGHRHLRNELLLSVSSFESWYLIVAMGTIPQERSLSIRRRRAGSSTRFPRTRKTTCSLTMIASRRRHCATRVSIRSTGSRY